MNIRLLRHAATVVTLGGKKILVDPMLKPAEAGDPIPTKGSGKGRRNPLVELPISSTELEELLNSLDAVLITHMHGDHFDDFEGKLIPKNLPILCQVEDAERLRAIGFNRLYPIEQVLSWEGITVTRFEARHGGLYWRRKMGIGSGYVLAHPGEPSLYITGDTIWCPPVRKALSQHRPDVIIAYMGAAQFPFGRSITMNTRDLAKVCQKAPQAKVVAVHMEAINHCLLTREKLRHYLKGKPFASALRIPMNGEKLDF